MKKITILIYVTLLSLIVVSAKAATIQVAAPADLTATYSGAADGTIIELTTSGGAYTWSAVAAISTDKSITLKAASGLAQKPVVTYSGATAGTTKYFINYTVAGSVTGTLTFDGIVIDGASKAAALFLTKCSASSNIEVIVSNCVLQHFYAGAKIFYYAAATTPIAKYGNLTVSNTVFKDFGTSVLNASGLTVTPDNVSFSNCLFEGPSTSTAIKVNTTGYNKITVDHCTFNNFSSNELYFTNAVNPNVLSNTIFANSTNTATANLFGSAASIVTLGANCGVYYTAAGTKSTLYPNSTSALATDPAIDANGYATASAFIGTGTDGKNIGYYNTASGADVTAPTVPAGLGNTTPTSSSFTLSWTASTDAVGVTAYDVYKDAVFYGTTASTSLAITGLSASTAYSMTVKAKDAASNTSAASIALVVTTAAAADVTAPTVPTGLGNTTPTSSSFTLSWTASTDAVGVTAYDVYKDAVLYGSTASTSLDITGLSASTAYSMTVKAKDAASNTSAASTALVVTTAAAADVTAPTVPTGLGNTTPTSSSFTLSWTASTDAVGVTAYDVYKDAVLYGSTASTSLDITGLSASTAYSMTVKAKDAASNTSNASTALVVTTAAAVSSTVWQVATGDISATYSNASFHSGDIIELTANGATGSYTWTTKVGTLTKSFTLRAGSSVTTRPIVTLPSGITLSSNNNTTPYSLSFDGIDFDGNAVATALTSAKGATGGDLIVSMNNCIVRNLTAAGRVFSYASSGTGWTTQAQWYGDLTVMNSEFSGTYAGVLSYGSQFAGPNNATFTNCYFAGLTATIISNGLASLNTTNSLTLDHCTFYASTGIEINIKNGGTSTTIVKNSLFANSPGSASATDVVALSTNPGNAANTNNAVYYTSNTQVISTRYPSGLLGAYITSNPTLVNHFATAAAYIGTAVDHRNIGYYNFAVLTPYITASETALTGFSYNVGSGPSSEKTFTVSAFDLSSNLVITPSSNYEISLTSGSGFTSSALSIAPSSNVVSETTIYVRLKSGLAINSYSGSITATHAGATTRTVTLSGQVNSTSPTIILSTATLSGFSRLEDGGASAPQNFTVEGVNMTGNVTVTAPDYFEISFNPLNGYTPYSLQITKSGTIVNPTLVYVRLKKSAAATTYSKDITLTSNGATVKYVTCSGSVTAISISNFNTNASNNIDLRIASNYSAAAMPIYTTQDHVNKVFVRNPACWAADLDLTCISPSNFNYDNLHAGTLITPRHAILAAHFKLSTGDSLYFVTSDNVTVRRKIIGYKTNTIFSPTQFPDLEIVTLDSDVPSTITPCKFLPSTYATYLSNNGRGLPTFSTDQEEKALVNEVSSFNSLLVINSNPAVMMYSERTCTTTQRLALHEAIISGDSGNPVFLIIRGQLVLVSARTWDNGAGTSYTHFANLATGGTTSPTDPTVNTLSINDLIAQTDAVAGVSTGYQVSYFNFNALATDNISTIATPDQVYSCHGVLYAKIANHENAYVSVYDIFGRLVLNQNVSGNLEYKLPMKGVYVVTLKKEGTQLTNYKIAVQ
ncbi:MAG: T9SS type A sorting domain-containing protein [Bacteroidales bacterium]|nr:T9SS type A sorting domain-containing protein [Bacteroidales bacterium]